MQCRPVLRELRGCPALPAGLGLRDSLVLELPRLNPECRRRNFLPIKSSRFSPTKTKASSHYDEALKISRIRRAYTLNEDPQPQVLFTFGLSNLKPAPSRVST